jgi:hypothetical protein
MANQFILLRQDSLPQSGTNTNLSEKDGILCLLPNFGNAIRRTRLKESARDFGPASKRGTLAIILLDLVQFHSHVTRFFIIMVIYY